MRAEIAIGVLIAWYALSTAVFILISAKPVFQALRTTFSFPIAWKHLGAYISWVVWTIAYSILMLCCLLLAALMNRAEALLAGILVYMAIGHLISLHLKVPTLAGRLMMLGAPPLQAAVTMATRSQGQGVG
jgi:hypothetical protein